MSKPVICIGGSFVDELFHSTEELIPATTNNAFVTKTAGGVSRNIAHQLALLNVPVQLISVFGNDSDGDWLKQVCSGSGVKLDASVTINGPSGKYTGILKQDGSLYAAFLSNSANSLITPGHLDQHKELFNSASWLLADANLTVEAIKWLLAFSNKSGIPLIIEPVSVPRARRLKEIDLNGLCLISPNEDEISALCSEKALLPQQQTEELLNRGIQYVWLHNGRSGSAIYSKGNTVELGAATVDVVDCTGAGDGALSGLILGKYLGMKDSECLKLAHTLSFEILQVNGAIATHLDQQKLLSLVSKYYPTNEFLFNHTPGSTTGIE